MLFASRFILSSLLDFDCTLLDIFLYYTDSKNKLMAMFFRAFL